MKAGDSMGIEACHGGRHEDESTNDGGTSPSEVTEALIRGRGRNDGQNVTRRVVRDKKGKKLARKKKGRKNVKKKKKNTCHHRATGAPQASRTFLSVV